MWKGCRAIARNATCLVSRETHFGDHQLSPILKLNVSLCFLLDHQLSPIVKLNVSLCFLLDVVGTGGGLPSIQLCLSLPNGTRSLPRCPLGLCTLMRLREAWSTAAPRSGADGVSVILFLQTRGQKTFLERAR